MFLTNEKYEITVSEAPHYSMNSTDNKKNDMLYCRGKEIAMEEKLAFRIVTDGKNCYHLATNIQAANGKSKCIYVCE